MRESEREGKAGRSSKIATKFQREIQREIRNSSKKEVQE